MRFRGKSFRQLCAYVILSIAVSWAVYDHVQSDNHTVRILRHTNFIQTLQISENKRAVNHLCTTQTALLDVIGIVYENLLFFVDDAEKHKTGNPVHDAPLIVSQSIFRHRLFFLGHDIQLIENDRACRGITLPALAKK